MLPFREPGARQTGRELLGAIRRAFGGDSAVKKTSKWRSGVVLPMKAKPVDMTIAVLWIMEAIGESGQPANWMGDPVGSICTSSPISKP